MALNPEDLKTDKYESSSDFGTKVLQNVRESNRLKEEEFFKRQKREQDREDLFKLVTPLAVGVGDAFFQNKADAFLNTEENALKVLTTRNAYKLAKSTTEEEEQARKFEGGYRAYFNRLGEERARADVQKKFGTKGTYSENQFTETLQSLGMDIGEELREAHEKRLELTRAYLSSRGGIEAGQDVYLNEIKKHTPDTLSKGITRGITNFLGLTPRQQISQRAERIFGTAERLVNYQKLYQETGDEAVSKSLEEILPKNIRNPAVELLGELKSETVPSDIFGNDPVERHFKAARTYDRETGDYRNFIFYYDQHGNPTGEVQTSFNARQKRSFDSAVSTVLNDEEMKKHYFQVYNKAIPANIRTEINEKIQEIVNSKFEANSVNQTAIANETKALTEGLLSRMGAAARIIQLETGMQEDAANKVALRMFLTDYNSRGLNSFQDGAGVMSPYATLNAMLDVQQDARITDKDISRMLGANGKDLVKSYLNASNNQRKRMQQNFVTFTNRQDMFSEQIRDSVTHFHNVATFLADQNLSSIPSDEQINMVRQLLEAQEDELKKQSAAEDTATVTSNPDKDNDSDVWQWIGDNPQLVNAAIAAGGIALAFTPPGALANIGIRVGQAGIMAGRAAWKFKKPVFDWIKKQTKNRFYTTKKSTVPSPAGTLKRKQEEFDSAKARKVVGLATAAPAVVSLAADAVPSLLADPKAPVVIPETVAVPEAVEDKISFVGEIFGDDANAITFMQRVVNQESNLGKNPNTYNMSADGKGRFGVAQVDRVAFNQVQKKLQDPNSSIFKFLKPFKDKTGIDLRTLSYSDLKEDVFSIAFGRLYLQQITDEPIPTTLEGQAALWKKYYNTVAGSGTTEDFINNNRQKSQ